jgi:hypothetical protein
MRARAHLAAPRKEVPLENAEKIGESPKPYGTKRGDDERYRKELGITMSEAALLRWCGTQLRESGVSVENFGSSFASGVALCHIVHRIGHGADATLARAAIEKREPAGNVRAALVGAKKLGVDDVITAEDVLKGDAALVVTFVAALFRAARKDKPARVPSVAMTTTARVAPRRASSPRPAPSAPPRSAAASSSTKA